MTQFSTHQGLTPALSFGIFAQMNLSNYSPEAEKQIRRLAKEFSDKHSKMELAIRIAAALNVSDACGDCTVETMRGLIIVGQKNFIFGKWLCEKCSGKAK